MWWLVAIAALYLVRRSAATPAPAPASPAITAETAVSIAPLPLPAMRAPFWMDEGVTGAVDPQRFAGVPEIATETPEMGDHFWASEGGTAGEYILKNPKLIAYSTASAGGSGAGGSGGGSSGGGGGAGGGHGMLK
jgi:hypothetical protein